MKHNSLIALAIIRLMLWSSGAPAQLASPSAQEATRQECLRLGGIMHAGACLLQPALPTPHVSPADAENAQAHCAAVGSAALSGPINEHQALARALLHKGNVPEAEVYIEKGGSAPPARPGYANDSYWRCVWAEEGFGAPRQMRLGDPKCWFPPTGPGNGDDHYGGCVVVGRDVVFTEQVETDQGQCWFPPGVLSPDRNGSGYAKCLSRAAH